MGTPVLRSTGVFLIFAENQFAMREIIQLVLWLWQMPQNIIGEILAFYYGGCTSFYRTGRYNRVAVVSSDRMRGGISLGNIIILPEFFSEKTLKHELGIANNRSISDGCTCLSSGCRQSSTRHCTERATTIISGRRSWRTDWARKSDKS